MRLLTVRDRIPNTRAWGGKKLRLRLGRKMEHGTVRSAGCCSPDLSTWHEGIHGIERLGSLGCGEASSSKNPSLWLFEFLRILGRLATPQLCNLNYSNTNPHRHQIDIFPRLECLMPCLNVNLSFTESALELHDSFYRNVPSFHVPDDDSGFASCCAPHSKQFRYPFSRRQSSTLIYDTLWLSQ